MWSTEKILKVITPLLDTRGLEVILFRKIIYICLLIAVLSGFSSAYETCSSTGQIHSNGEVDVRFERTVSPSSGYYYPAHETWAIAVPRQATNIEVRDGNSVLEFGIGARYSFIKELWMENAERIDDHEYYTFNVTYELPRGATVFEDEIYYSDNFPAFCDESSNASIILPENIEVSESSVDYVRDGDRLRISQLGNAGEVELYLSLARSLTEPANFESGIFQVSSPELYEVYVLNQTREANSYLDDVEDRTGINAPDKVDLVYLAPNSSNISMDAAGEYSNGELRMSSKLLSSSRTDGLETLIHELVHAYNTEVRGNITDWWWEEGTAQYVTYQLLEDQGYYVSSFRESELAINETFENCMYERSFILEWNPAEDSDLTVDPLYPCGTEELTFEGSSIEVGDTGTEDVDYITDRDSLGYAYSRLIVEKLAQRNPEVVSRVHADMISRNITFVEDRQLRNNQINFFTSRVVEEDLTEFYRQKGMPVNPWSRDWYEIQAAKDNVMTYEESTKYDIYEPELDQLRDAEQVFFGGKFSEASTRAGSIVENLEEINESYTKAIEEYRTVSRFINELESQEEPVFYEASKSVLDDALNEIKNREFDRASTTIKEARSLARERSMQIQRYENLTKDVENDMASRTVMTVFTGNAEEKLRSSESAYANGDIEKALADAETSQQQVTRATSKAIALVIVILLVIVSFYKRNEIAAKTKRGLAYG